MLLSILVDNLAIRWPDVMILVFLHSLDKYSTESHSMDLHSTVLPLQRSKIILEYKDKLEKRKQGEGTLEKKQHQKTHDLGHIKQKY